MACAFSLLLQGQPAFAITKADALMPFTVERDLYQSAMKELQRQGDLQLTLLKKHKKVMDGLVASFDENVLRVNEQNQAERKKFDTLLQAGDTMIRNEGEKVYVPGIGWLTKEELKKQTADANATISLSEKSIQEGAAEFHIAGIGWLTRQGLDKIIADKNKEIQDVESALKDGSYSIFYPGLGEVTKITLSQQLDRMNSKISEATNAIDAGEYIVYLPGLGGITRNQLDGRINEVKAKIQYTKELFKSGAAKIDRRLFERSNKTEVKDVIAEVKKQSADLKQSLRNKEYEHHFPTGWATGKKLGNQGATLKKEIDDVRTKVNMNQYKAPLQDGTWATAKDLEMALMNNLISPEIRSTLEKGLADITPSAELLIALKEIEVEKLKLWSKALNKHAASEQALLGYEITRLQTFEKEFKQEETRTLGDLQRTLKWLQRYRKLMP